MADGNQVTVVARPHPLGVDTAFAKFNCGKTIAELLGPDVSRTVMVECGGYPVPREAWACVRPKPGVTLHVTLYP